MSNETRAALARLFAMIGLCGAGMSLAELAQDHTVWGALSRLAYYGAGIFVGLSFARGFELLRMEKRR